MRPAAAVGTLAAVAGASAAAMVGLRVDPAPFPAFPGDSRELGSVPIPEDLPQPVERWLRSVYGDQVPLITTAVVTGRARIRPFGFWLPARFRFIHECGYNYRHYIEATVYGQAVLKVNERYLDGRSLIDIPVVGKDSGPKVEQAANLGMWAELAAAAPAVLATDPRVLWRPIDDTHATLIVPFGGNGHDEFAATFDVASGGLRRLEAWRYRSSKEDGKVLWIAENQPGPPIPGTRLPAVGTATWADMGQPWARFVTEDVRVNVDVSDSLRRVGL